MQFLKLTDLDMTLSRWCHIRRFAQRVNRKANPTAPRAFGKRLRTCEEAIERLRGSFEGLRAGWEFARCLGIGRAAKINLKMTERRLVGHLITTPSHLYIFWEATFLRAGVPEVDGGRSLSSVENVPSFISDSNMTVIYTYSGATAHIDCGVNMLGKIIDSQYPYISNSNVLF